MKKIKFACICFIAFPLSFIANIALADNSQSLLIPKIDNPIKAKNGTIELPAFCSDISKTWLDGAVMGTILWGGAETILHIIVNGHAENPTLAFSVQHHYIKIVAGNRSVIIKSLTKGVKLLNAQSNGFLVGTVGSSSFITRQEYISNIESFNDLQYNIDAWNYYVYQQKWWKVINNIEKNNAAILKKRANEVAVKYFKKKEMDVTITEEGVIKLLDRGRNIKLIENFYTEQVFEISNIRRLKLQSEDEIEDWEICLSFDPADSAFMSLTLAGKYNNILPIQIEYSSTNDIKISTSVKKEMKLTKGMTLEGELAVEVDLKDGNINFDSPFKKCEVKLTGKICYPGGAKLEAEVCGIKLNMDIKRVFFNDF